MRQDASNLYLAMEFHAGGDLLSLIQRMGNRLEETAVRFYTAEVLINFFYRAEDKCAHFGHSFGSTLVSLLIRIQWVFPLCTVLIRRACMHFVVTDTVSDQHWFQFLIRI